jgi:hypothetical protein
VRALWQGKIEPSLTGPYRPAALCRFITSATLYLHRRRCWRADTLYFRSGLIFKSLPTAPKGFDEDDVMEKAVKSSRYRNNTFHPKHTQAIFWGNVPVVRAEDTASSDQPAGLISGGGVTFSMHSQPATVSIYRLGSVPREKTNIM